MNLNFTDTISYLTSVELQESLLLLKIVFLIFSLFFLVAIIYFLLRTRFLRLFFLQDWFEFLTYKPYGIRKLAKQWAKIMARLELATESEYKLAVIEADSLLGDTLEKMGYPGETLGDRLKFLTKDILPNLDLVWEAHKTRNNIIYDPDYRLDLDQTRRTLEIFERALRDLGAL